jgi:hypothetical protein
VSSIEQVRSVDEVPGVRFLIDTGHVTAWGGDVLELLPFAAHVQLRDVAGLGRPQVAPATGTSTCPILERLDALGYGGGVGRVLRSPEYGWPCDDVRAYATLRELVENDS